MPYRRFLHRPNSAKLFDICPRRGPAKGANELIVFSLCKRVTKTVSTCCSLLSCCSGRYPLCQVEQERVSLSERYCRSLEFASSLQSRGASVISIQEGSLDRGSFVPCFSFHSVRIVKARALLFGNLKCSLETGRLRYSRRQQVPSIALLRGLRQEPS